MNNWPLMSNNITREDADCLIDFLNQDPLPQLTNGPMVRRFEEEWGKLLGTKYNVMVNSGSSANELSFLALKHIHQDGGEIICPPLGWVSDYAAILQNGFTPVFCDIKFSNLALDIEEVKKKITDKTRAILLIHILGFNGLTQELLDLCKEKNIALIEDCCESHCATFQGKYVGSFGLMSNFSFYFAHHMTTCEGGMISTDSESMYQLCRMFRSHGMLRECTNEHLKEVYKQSYPDLNQDFIFTEAAHNHRSTELNAVLGLNQIGRLESNSKIRAENLGLFLSGLDSNKYFTKFDQEGNSNYAFTLILKEQNFALRNKVELALKANGIEFRRGLSGGGNMLRQPYLRRIFGNSYSKFPITDHCHHFGWYIGNYPDLPKENIRFLCDLVNNI